MKIAVLLGSVAASALSTTLIAARDRQAPPAAPAALPAPAEVRSTGVLGPNALPPIPTVVPLLPQGAPGLASPQFPAAVAAARPPAPPVTSSRSSGG